MNVNAVGNKKYLKRGLFSGTQDGHIMDIPWIYHGCTEDTDWASAKRAAQRAKPFPELGA